MSTTDRHLTSMANGTDWTLWVITRPRIGARYMLVSPSGRMLMRYTAAQVAMKDAAQHGAIIRHWTD
jgi:hypothetical protein